MGIPVLVRDILSRDRSSKDPIEIYGPRGLRSFIRNTFRISHSTSTMLSARKPDSNTHKFRVHELLRPDETPSVPAAGERGEEGGLDHCEMEGGDIRCGEDGSWENFCVTDAFNVTATSIAHRAPSFGFTFQETIRPVHLNATHQVSKHDRVPRKIVLLGDTSDPASVVPYAMNVDVLVHESTLAHIVVSDNVDVAKPENQLEADAITKKAIDRGHSTASMAGAFAKTINARILALNHFSARYPGLRKDDPVMASIERQAGEEGHESLIVKATFDFLTLELLDGDNILWTAL